MKFKWRFRGTSWGEDFAWTYKRNYKAELVDQDGDYYLAYIEETSGDKPKIILSLGGMDEVMTEERAEEILRLLASGQPFEPNDAEKSCAEYKFHPENINYMPKTPYELAQEAL